MKDENYQPFSNEQFKLTNMALKSKMPFGFYYDVQSRHIEPNGLEINSGDYTFSTNFCMWQNSKDFLRLLKIKRGAELCEEFEVQLFYYMLRIKNISSGLQAIELAKWFNYTTKLLNEKASLYMDGLDNKYAKYEFAKWLKIKQKEIKFLKPGEVINVEVLQKIEIENIPPTDKEEKNVLIESQLNGVNGDSDHIEEKFILSTIEEKLKPFETIIHDQSYHCLVKSLKAYFKDGVFPTTINEIKIGKVNVKALGWALYSIYKKLKTNKEKLSYEYLKFGKDNISIFKDVELIKDDIKCNLYRYYTTKTLMKST